MDCLVRTGFWAVWLIVPAKSSLCSQEIDRQLERQFRAAVMETEGKLRQLSFRVKCTYTTRFVWVSDEVLAKLQKMNKKPYVPRAQEFGFAIRGKFTLQEDGSDGENAKDVLGMNDRYAFQIQRISAAQPYSLTFLEPLGGNRVEDEHIHQVCRDARVLPLCTWLVASLSVPDLVKSPYFEITGLFSVPRDQSNGADLVRIEFDHPFDDPSTRSREWMSDAYMICDPSRGWALTEYSVTLEDGSTYHATLESGNLVDGFPIPKTMTRLITAENVSTREAVATFDLISDDVPKEEFYLSHYDLPEPTFRRGWLGTWVWYLAAGIVCLVVSVMILKRRKAAM